MASAGAALGVGGVVWGDGQTHHLIQEEHELLLPKWDANGFKVALVSDIHTNNALAGARAKRAFQMAVASKPNLIAVPGDFINYDSPWPIKYLGEALQGLEGVQCPVVATLGNHDYRSEAVPKIIETLRQFGVRVLFNETAECEGVSVAGVDDALYGTMSTTFLYSSGHMSKSSLCLLHEPDFVTQMPAHVSLMLSGHSHGGQICLPTGHALLTPFGAQKYFSGYYANAQVPLYVTRGVGTTGPNIRLFAPPEVSILTLRSD